MRISNLVFLKCPYCGSNLEVKEIVEEKGGEMLSGIVKCECTEFPVLESILTLKTNPIYKQIIELIEKRKIAEATIRCIWNEYFERMNCLPPVNSKIGWMLSSILSRISRIESKSKYKRLYRKYTDNSVSFCNLLDVDAFGMFGHYAKHRFSMGSLWLIYPFLPLFKKKNLRILDLSCGTGHGSYILSNYVAPHELFCADFSFQNLYLTRKYFVKKGEFICLDANYPLPFTDKIFSSILFSDAYFLITSRSSLAREMERILNPDGFLLLSHLHNSLFDNPGGGGGYPMTPKGWRRLFNFGKPLVKAMPERTVVEDFLVHNKLELAKEYDENSLNSSNAIDLLITSDVSLFTTYGKVNDDFLSVKKNLVINPIYEVKEGKTRTLLERPALEDSLGEFYPLAEKYMPCSYEFDKESVSGRRVRITNPAELEALMKQFILINVPENYL